MKCFSSKQAKDLTTENDPQWKFQFESKSNFHQQEKTKSNPDFSLLEQII